MNLPQNINQIIGEVESISVRLNIPKARIIAASKTVSPVRIKEAFEHGITNFGENYVQELVEKYKELSELSIQWHFIGHLQRNKVKYVAPFISMIHSVDSIELAKEIQKQALKHSKTIDVLFQVNTSGEESKSGMSPDNLRSVVEGCLELPNVRLCGLMTIPSATATNEGLRKEYSLLRTMLNEVRQSYAIPTFTELSMGMSDDYTLAIQEGATMIRPGSAIFGERIYT
jgi:PLP dependent protein